MFSKSPRVQGYKTVFFTQKSCKKRPFCQTQGVNGFGGQKCRHTAGHQPYIYIYIYMWRPLGFAVQYGLTLCLRQAKFAQKGNIWHLTAYTEIRHEDDHSKKLLREEKAQVLRKTNDVVSKS